jgi:hypothetical protein
VRKFILLFISLFLSAPLVTRGFSLLSHEAIIDATWDKSIKPLLKTKYPSATEKELKEAHAYLYGGSLMPDIGYYPFGSMLFTNLVHYVRTGDFITAALEGAENLNEYAFGLGLLCHYNADKYGHALGTNLALPVLFPKERKEHGDTVTYMHARTAHVKTEFGFDVFQTAKGNYSREAQHNFIAFKVSEPGLERAFLKTYGLELKTVFKSLPVAVETFRFTVKRLFPELAKDAWKVRKSVITKINPLAEQAKYTQKMDRKSYNKEFGKPDIKSSVLALVIGVLPKVGPFAGLKFKEPSDEAEKLFDKSFKAIITHYAGALKKLESSPPRIENINYDTGKKTARYEYFLADKNYYKLLKSHERNKFKNMTPELQQNLLAFYSAGFAKPPGVKKDYKSRQIARSIQDLEAAEIKQSATRPL